MLGWITNASVLQAVAGRIGSVAHQDGPVPPDSLPGYQVLEVALAEGSPAAGQALGSVRWPPGSFPVSVLRARRLREPDPALTLAAGDRVSLLARVPGQALPGAAAGREKVGS